MSLVLKILMMAVLIVAARISHYQVFCGAILEKKKPKSRWPSRAVRSWQLVAMFELMSCNDLSAGGLSRRCGECRLL